jgi:hypothetical protein
MITFLKYLEEQEKITKPYGINTGHSPGKMFSVVNPAKPVSPNFSGLNLSVTNSFSKNAKSKLK